MRVNFSFFPTWKTYYLTEVLVVMSYSIWIYKVYQSTGYELESLECFQDYYWLGFYGLTMRILTKKNNTLNSMYFDYLRIYLLYSNLMQFQNTFVYFYRSKYIRNTDLGIDEIWISENDIRIVATLSYTNVIRKERGNQGSQLFHIDTKKMGTNLISFVIIPKYLFFFA